MGKWFEPRSISCSSVVIIRVRTGASERLLLVSDISTLILSGSHLQTTASSGS